MTADDQKLRLYGVYRQDKEDHFMLRVKIPAGALNSAQADRISSLSEQFSNGRLHLTSRGSMEFHWLRHEHLDEIFLRLAEVGLTSRGACGGAVRGISCNTTSNPDYPVVQVVAQRINQHFAGNPDFEGLPKKFKVGIEAGYQGSRHLIQDLGFVLVSGSNSPASFDIWCAGGLGREPQAAFLLEAGFPESRLLHLIESVVQIYRANTPPPKRLKFLLNSIGEKEFRRLLQEELAQRPQPASPQVDRNATLIPKGGYLEIPVFAGELKTSLLRQLATISRDVAGGFLVVTTDQNIALLTASDRETERLKLALVQHQINPGESDFLARFRVCPGNHECRMGLAPTRDIARNIIASADPAIRGHSWAISGCRNSCSQPQLADFGIVTSKLQTTDAGRKQPLFDLYRRKGDALGRCIAEGLSVGGLYEFIGSLKA